MRRGCSRSVVILSHHAAAPHRRLMKELVVSCAMPTYSWACLATPEHAHEYVGMAHSCFQTSVLTKHLGRCHAPEILREYADDDGSCHATTCTAPSAAN